MKRILLFITMIACLVLSYIFIPQPKTNFDMSTYLPSDSMTQTGLKILEDEFEIENAIQIMISNIETTELILKKIDIYQISHVKKVIWLDDFVDLELVPIDFIDPNIKNAFYQDQTALITVVFDTDAYDVNLKSSVTDIEDIFNEYDISMRGQAIDNIYSRGVAENEMIKVMVLIIPIILFILIMVSKTWIEPVFILITLGIAVLFNVITNGILGQISYITLTLAIALQLALSIDYALILIHRFYEERQFHGAKQAAMIALRSTFKSITGSALTTIIGFSALMVMHYRIGLDIGLVLAKGILFSYLSSIIILPILLSWSNHHMDPSKFRKLLPSISFKKTFLFKFKYIFLGLFIVLFALSGYFQTKANFFYGSSALSKDHLNHNETISLTFGPYSPMIALFPNMTIDEEIALLDTLTNQEHILGIQSLITVVDPLIPREFIPDSIKSEFIGKSYTKWIIYTNITEENDEAYQFINQLKDSLSEYDNYYILSEMAAISEIKTSVTNQEIWITLLAILSVMLVIGLIFKSIWIPVVLVSLIQGAIWINVSFGYFMNTQVQYIGYLVVMSIQLGATIDYAILLTHRYLECRKTLDKNQAMSYAFTKSFKTILISSTILAIAGFVEGIFSEIQTVTDIGILLGRGALISSFVIIVFLPNMLKIIDPIITKNNQYIKT